MPSVLKVWIILWFFMSGLVVACTKEDRSSKKSSESIETKTTNICGADWAGDKGDLIFPGLVTYEECEELCEPIYEQLIEENGSGYCQFGAERIWEYPEYLNE